MPFLLLELSKVEDFMAKMRTFRSKRYNFDENNGDYLRRNWRSIELYLPFEDERFYFRQLLN